MQNSYFYGGGEHKNNEFAYMLHFLLKLAIEQISQRKRSGSETLVMTCVIASFNWTFDIFYANCCTWKHFGLLLI